MGWLASLARTIREMLPRGGTLPETFWQRRHRGILVLLWLHVPTVLLFALVRGESAGHALFEAGAVGVFAVAATWICSSHRASTIAAALGLLTASATLVHLSEGVIEVHFHFFVMVGVITLYQDWRTFLVAVGYVVVQHGVMGGLAPESVYNHPAAVEDPWTWAGIHGLFILGMSAVGIVSWRLNESLVEAVSDRQQRLAEAQALAHLGSWEWNVGTDEMVWSAEQCRLLGFEAGDQDLTYGDFLARVHLEDRRLVTEQLRLAVDRDAEFALDMRVVRPDGEVRWHHARGAVTKRDHEGRPVVLAGTSQDITDRRDWEDALRESEAGLKETLSLLSATLDSTADGILVVDADGNITSFNQKFVEMWQIPQSVLDARDDAAALDFVLGQLKDPAGFLAKVNELYAQPDADSHDILEFLDDRVFERYSTPQRVGGVSVGRVWSFRDITGPRRLEAELSHRAFHDSLTGLANQLLFRERVDHALARAQRSDEVLAVLFLDLDNFKTVNDSLGHPVGDELLVAVAHRLERCLRQADTAARLGGDEFVLLLEGGSDRSEAVAIADRVLEVLREPFAVGSKEVYLSASIGIAFAGPATTGSDVLLRNADVAMYRAKGEGKSRYQVFEASMHAEVLERLDLEADLRRAVERDELVIHYQPIVDLEGGDLFGVEALVRWDHPVRGLLYPAAFIAVAEETGIIDDIGRFVLEQATRQVREWQARYPGAAQLALSVNVAAHQLSDPALIDDVDRALRASGLDPALLTLEITEGAMVQSAETSGAETTTELSALKALGVRLAIDDFGTGYSSLSYLQRFPIDVLKIDKTFVQGVGQGAEDDGLPRAIVKLAQTLRVVAVAEGVETPGQLELLRAWGCKLGQGYLFARPLEATGMEGLLATGRPHALLPAQDAAAEPPVLVPVTPPVRS